MAEKKTYTATVSVPVLVRVTVEAENIEIAKLHAKHAPSVSMIIDAAEWGRFQNERVIIYEIEEGQREF